MDKIEKLFRRISEQDRHRLLDVIDKIIKRDKDLKIIKIQNSDFFRVRCGQFRIIYHQEKSQIIIDNIRLRDKNTYKNL